MSEGPLIRLKIPAQLRRLGDDFERFIRHDTELVRFRGGKAYARVDIPANTAVQGEFAVAYVHVPDDIPPLVFAHHPHRELLTLCAQLILGNDQFARQLHRYAPERVNPRIEPLVKPQPGTTVTPLTCAWFAVISLCEDLGLPSEGVEWWKKGERLPRLYQAVVGLVHCPSDILTNEIGNDIGVWISSSQAAHRCADSANCIEYLEIMHEKDGGAMPLLTLFTTRDVKKGEELTWSRATQAPFGLDSECDRDLRRAAELGVGLVCTCDECEDMHREKREKDSMEARRKIEEQRKAVKTSRKKKKKKQRKNNNQRGGHSPKKSSSSLSSGSSTATSTKVLSGTRKMTFGDDESKPGVTMIVDPFTGNILLQNAGPEVRKKLAAMQPQLRPTIPFNTDEDIEEKFFGELELLPSISGRPPAPSFNVIRHAALQAEFFAEVAFANMQKAYVLRKWDVVLDLCETIRKSHQRSLALMPCLIENKPIVLELCEKFLAAQHHRMTDIHESAWWWAALNFRLHTTYGKEPRMRLASCYAGIIVEMGILHENPKDMAAADRMVGYHSRLCDELKALFGHNKALAMAAKELCRTPWYRTDEGFIPALKGSMPMYPFLTMHYKTFCRARGFDEFDEDQEEAIRAAADKCIPQFYPMPEEVAALTVQSHIKTKKMTREFHAMREAAITFQRAIRSVLEMRRQRKRYLVLRRGVEMMQAHFRGKITRLLVEEKRCNQMLQESTKVLEEIPNRWHLAIRVLQCRRPCPAVEVQSITVDTMVLQKTLQRYQRQQELLPHVMKLQAMVKARQQHHNFQQLKSAVLLIQAFARRHFARQHLEKLKIKVARIKLEEERRDKKRLKLEEEQRRHEEKERRRREMEEERMRRAKEKKLRKQQRRREEEERRLREKAQEEEERRQQQAQEEEERRQREEQEAHEEEERRQQMLHRAQEELRMHLERKAEEERSRQVMHPETDVRVVPMSDLEREQYQLMLAMQHHQMALLQHQLDLARLQQSQYWGPPPVYDEPPPGSQVVEGGGFVYENVFYPPPPPRSQPGVVFQPHLLYPQPVHHYHQSNNVVTPPDSERE